MDMPRSPLSENVGINLPTPIERDFDTPDQPTSSASEPFPSLQIDTHRDRSSAPSPGDLPRCPEVYTAISPIYPPGHKSPQYNPNSRRLSSSPGAESDESRRRYFDTLASSSAEKRRCSTASTVVPFESLDRGNNYKRHKRNISSIDMSDKENAEELAEYHGRSKDPLPSIEEFVRDQAEAARTEVRRSFDDHSIDIHEDAAVPSGSPNSPQILPTRTASTISELVLNDQDDPQDLILRAVRMFERIKLYFTRQIINTPNDLRIDLRAELVLHAAVVKYGQLTDGEVVHDDTESEIASLLGREGDLSEEAVHDGEDEESQTGGIEPKEQAGQSNGQVMTPEYEADDED